VFLGIGALFQVEVFAIGMVVDEKHPLIPSWRQIWWNPVINSLYINGVSIIERINLWSIQFHDVATRNLVASHFLRFEFGQIQATLVNFDFFNQHIHPLVVTVEVELKEVRTGWPGTGQIAEVISQHITHQGLIGVRPVKHPVVFFRHAQERHIQILPQLVPGLHRVAFLRKIRRRIAPDLDTNLAVVFKGCVFQGVKSGRAVKHRHINHNLLNLVNGLPTSIDAYQRQITHAQIHGFCKPGRQRLVGIPGGLHPGVQEDPGREVGTGKILVEHVDGQCVQSINQQGRI